MKTGITHKILVAVSKEALKRGLKTDLVYNHGEWSLYMYVDIGRIRIGRDTKIRDIERWMKKIDMTWKSEIAPTNDKMSKLSIVETDAAGAAVVEARLAFGGAYHLKSKQQENES